MKRKNYMTENLSESFEVTPVFGNICFQQFLWLKIDHTKPINMKHEHQRPIDINQKMILFSSVLPYFLLFEVIYAQCSKSTFLLEIR